LAADIIAQAFARRWPALRGAGTLERLIANGSGPVLRASGISDHLALNLHF
jgi:hypothetical protein